MRDYNQWFSPKKTEPPKTKQLTKEQYEEVLPLAIQYFKFVFIDSIKKDHPEISVFDLDIKNYTYNGLLKGLCIQYKNQKSLEFYLGFDGMWYKVNGLANTEKVYDAQLTRLLKPILDEYFNSVEVS